MSKVYKFKNYYIAGVSHVIPGYYQDVVIIYNNNGRWNAVSAERFNINDKELAEIKEAIKYATHEDDLIKSIEILRSKGLRIEEVSKIPFPQNLIEGKKKIQEEFD
jgi:hypothetical protein